MKPTTYNRTRPSNLLNFFDEVLNSSAFSGDLAPAFTAKLKPAVNITETEDAYELELIAPGRKREDFKLEVKDDLLSIRYELEQKEETEKAGYLRREYRLENFQRSFHLDPKVIDEDQITASYQDGILTVRLAKKEEALPKQPKLIAVGN